MAEPKQGLIPRYTTRYDIIEAHYWWNVDHHTGLWSDAYARACKLSRYFKPGRLANGPEEYVARDVYNTLCDKARCTHRLLKLGE